MSLIPHSQFVLARLRRSVEKALAERDWAAISGIDAQLMKALSFAADSEERNLPALIKEVEAVVVVYRRLMAACDAELGELALDH